MSDFQESAQLLSGDALPRALLQAIIAKTAVPESGWCLLVNLTTYDCHLEKVCKKWKNETNVGFKTLSIARNLSIAQFVEKNLALELLEDCS